MELSQELMEKMERFCRQELDSAETAAFEEALAADAFLAEALALFRASQQAAEHAGREQDRAKLAQIKERLKEQETLKKCGKRPPKTYFFLMAASLLVLVLFSLVYFRQAPGSQELSLYEIHFEAYPDKVTTMGASPPGATLAGAMADYKAGRYAVALPKFEALEPVQGQGALLSLYKGICQMETGDLAAARSSFAEAERLDGKLAGAAHWYTGMAHLQQAAPQAALQEFERAAQTDPYYAPKLAAVKADIAARTAED